MPLLSRNEIIWFRVSVPFSKFESNTVIRLGPCPRESVPEVSENYSKQIHVGDLLHDTYLPSIQVDVLEKITLVVIYFHRVVEEPIFSCL